MSRVDPGQQLMVRPARWEQIVAVLGVVVLPTLNLALLIVVLVLVAGR